MANGRTINRRALIDSGVFIAIAMVCLAEAYRLHATADPNALTQELAPGLYIFFLGLILLVSGVIHLLTNLRAAEETTPVESDAGRPMKFGPVAIVGALAGYAALIPVIGYYAASFLFFVAIFWIFRIRNWLMNLALSIVLSTIFYFVFVHYLNIIFPRGALFDF